MKFRLTVALIFCGIALVFLGGKGLFFRMKPAQFLYAQDCNWDELKNGQRVRADIDFVFEPFCETTQDGKSTNCLYLFPDLREREDGSVYIANFMGVQVMAKDYSTYDSIVNCSASVWDKGEGHLGDGGVVKFDGYLRKMDDEELGFLKKTLTKYWGYDESQLDDLIVPYIMVKNNTPLANIAMFCGGFVLLAGGAVMAIFSFKKR
ncbi:MAG: hypothetical protein J6U09_05690 [Lachnospiraceae bacterium]|nr:hypothetical protein [Lachnospiraceae bacterium]